METTRYIRDHLFYGLRKPLQEVIHAKFDSPLNDYMDLMSVARKAEGEHEHVLLNQVLLVKPIQPRGKC